MSVQNTKLMSTLTQVRMEADTLKTTNEAQRTELDRAVREIEVLVRAHTGSSSCPSACFCRREQRVFMLVHNALRALLACGAGNCVGGAR